MAKLWLCAEYASRNRLMGLDLVDDPPDFMLTPREAEERRLRAEQQAD